MRRRFYEQLTSSDLSIDAPVSYSNDLRNSTALTPVSRRDDVSFSDVENKEPSRQVIRVSSQSLQELSVSFAILRTKSFRLRGQFIVTPISKSDDGRYYYDVYSNAWMRGAYLKNLVSKLVPHTVTVTELTK